MDLITQENEIISENVSITGQVLELTHVHLNKFYDYVLYNLINEFEEQYSLQLCTL